MDIGTNSTLFLLAKIDDRGKIYPIHHDVRTNDLGRGLSPEGLLNDHTVELNLNIINDFKKISVDNGAAEIRIVATEALRRARNAEDLIDRAKEEHGLAIAIITGEEEAALTFKGIISGLNDPMGKIIAADIGGGSSEIVIAENGNIKFSTSLPIGAVSLDKEFIHHDPPDSEEIEHIRKAAFRAVKILPLSLADDEYHLVICGGTASSLAAADLKLSTYQPEIIANHLMALTRIEQFIADFINMTVEERREIPGIGLRRAEIILPGTILIASLLDRLKRDHYHTSERGLRYGLLVNSGKADNFA